MSKYLVVIICVIICEYAAALTGFIYWKKFKDSHWRWLPIYLLLIALSDSLGTYFYYGMGNRDLNINWYTYFVLPLEFLFFYWLFKKYFDKQKEQIWAIGCAVAYVIGWIVEELFLKGKIKGFPSLSFSIGNLGLLILIIVFFIKLTRTEQLLSYKKVMMSWVALGLFVFPLTFPFNALRNTLATHYPDLFNPIWYTVQGLNCLMYILFIIGFISAERE